MSTKQGKSWTENADEVERLRAALDTIAHSFWEEGEPFEERLADVQQQARAALAKAVQS